ncbi:hypothetical protein DTW90_37445 [Neorhizobium sp. P12A]|uniref:hypothetical protein n=1 Tax=Neorhizobium sp. P12A TaxID=2268027 RepID=UPI0011EDDC0E|nr:hypothetical protein [Neorhizobium sp. P12A]KAA0679595.1 hypothetical protein DTW90_37445 [Neorhizobium sp. P12A]
MPKKPSDIRDAIAQLNAAHTSMLLALVKTLEETGTIKAQHYEANVRIVAAMTAKDHPGLAAELLALFAEQLRRDWPEGKA